MARTVASILEDILSAQCRRYGRVLAVRQAMPEGVSDEEVDLSLLEVLKAELALAEHVEKLGAAGPATHEAGLPSPAAPS